MNLNDIVLRIIIFVIIILLGLVVGKVVSNLIKKGVKELEIGRLLKKADIKFNPNKFLPSLSKYVVYFLTILIALNFVGITKIVFYVIVVVLGLVIISYVLISIKDLIPNFYYGFKVKKKYKVGKKIKYKNIKGEIIHMNSFELQVKNGDEIIYIPYRLLK